MKWTISLILILKKNIKISSYSPILNNINFYNPLSNFPSHSISFIFIASESSNDFSTIYLSFQHTSLYLYLRFSLIPNFLFSLHISITHSSISFWYLKFFFLFWPQPQPRPQPLTDLGQYLSHRSLARAAGSGNDDGAPALQGPVQLENFIHDLAVAVESALP